MDPLALLQDDLKQNDDTTQSLEKLSLVAFGIGPERTRTELLPVLKAQVQEFMNNENDEALAMIAKQLSSLGKLLGAQHIHHLNELLEQLCTSDEVVVRNSAIESYKELLPIMPVNHVDQHILPTIRRMAESTNWMIRQALCYLIPTVYGASSTAKRPELLQTFQTLTSDNSPLVRQASSSEIGPLSLHLDKAQVVQHMIGTVQTLAEDHLDYMRAYTPTAFADITSRFTADDNVRHVLPLIEALVNDASWKVRDSLAKAFPKICDHMGSELMESKLIPIYARLLADKDKCVRLSVATNVHTIANSCPNKELVVQQFSAQLPSYAHDASEKVRITFSKAIVHLLNAFGSEAAQKVLLPLITDMAEEECALVRSSIFSQIEPMTQILGVEVLSNVLLPAFIPYTRDVKWRVRWEMIGKIALLAELLGEEAFESKGLRGVLISGLQDHVFSIRDRACEMVRDLMKLWGPDWSIEHLLPEALRLYNTSTNYLHRMIPLRIVSLSCALMADSAAIERHLLPLVILACKDTVANVRFAAAKTVVDVLPFVDGDVITSQIQPLLTHMGRDEDVDVQYYAEVALKKAESSLS